MENSQITIGELSLKSGLSRDSIRYYEKLKLLKQSDRTDGNYRLYNALDSLARLAFIKKAQKLQFTLQEIKSILDAGTPPCCDKVKSLLAQKISNLKDEYKKIGEQLNFLESVEQEWLQAKESLSQESEFCPLIESL
jgi:MerR family copper efflux transcriptional regulator